MKTIHCLLEFRKYRFTKLDTFSNLVYNGIYTNVIVFPNPPVSEAEYKILQSIYVRSSADYKLYGITKKTAMIKAKNNLTDMLVEMAIYVDTLAQGNTSMIALAGFKPSKEKFERVDSLDNIPEFDFIPTRVTGQVNVDILAITDKGTITYSCFCVEGAPLANSRFINGQIVMAADDPQIHFDFNKSRKKVFQGLKAGTKYYFYAFASNTMSVSPLSDAKGVWVS